MSVAVFFFGGFRASWHDVEDWRKTAKVQKPAIDFVVFPWPDDTNDSGDASAIKGFSKGGRLDKVVGDIDGHAAETVYVVGHSSGCAIANKVDTRLKSNGKIVLVSLDGFRPNADQLKRESTQVWGANCDGVHSLHYPSLSTPRRHVYEATGAKTSWALHFSLVNANARDANVKSIKTGYADCQANLCFLI